MGNVPTKERLEHQVKVLEQSWYNTKYLEGQFTPGGKQHKVFSERSQSLEAEINRLKEQIAAMDAPLSAK